MSQRVAHFVAKSSGSLAWFAWSHRGRLQRQPSWKWWYRPGTMCFFFLSAGIPSASPFTFAVPEFFFSPTCSFSDPWTSSSISVPFLLLSHANSLICKCKNTSEDGKDRRGEMNLSPSLVHTHTPPPPIHPVLSLSSTAHLNKLTLLDSLCAHASTLSCKPTHCPPPRTYASMSRNTQLVRACARPPVARQPDISVLHCMLA